MVKIFALAACLLAGLQTSFAAPSSALLNARGLLDPVPQGTKPACNVEDARFSERANYSYTTTENIGYLRSPSNYHVVVTLAPHTSYRASCSYNAAITMVNNSDSEKRQYLGQVSWIASQIAEHCHFMGNAVNGQSEFEGVLTIVHKSSC